MSDVVVVESGDDDETGGTAPAIAATGLAAGAAAATAADAKEESGEAKAESEAAAATASAAGEVASEASATANAAAATVESVLAAVTEQSQKIDNFLAGQQQAEPELPGPREEETPAKQEKTSEGSDDKPKPKRHRYGSKFFYGDAAYEDD